MKKVDNKLSLPRFVPGSRVRRSALLISFLLHAALLSAILVIPFNPPETIERSSVVRIAIFPSLTDDGLDALTGGDDQRDFGETPVLAERPIAGAIPTETPAEPVEEPPSEYGVDDSTIVADVPAPSPSDANDSDVVEQPEQEVAASARVIGHDEPLETSETVAVEDELVVVSENATEPVRNSLEPASTSPVSSESVTETESVLLTRRIERWARSFAALSDWQPDTTFRSRGREYSATVERTPASGAMGYETATVTITTERNGEALTTQMRMRRLGFSHFAQFIDEWDPKVQIHDDVIDGRFHSNTEIFIGRSSGVQPTFTGLVTAPLGVNTTRSRQRVRRSEIFLGGLDMDAMRVALPRTAARFDDESEFDADQIHRFDSDTRIVFHADGSYTWSPVKSSRRSGPEDDRSETQSVGRVSSEPHFFVASDGVELRVRGTVNGRVLLYSPRGIVVEDDLVYAADPRQHPESDDYLGLVSERTVEIAEPTVTGTGDLHVHAAIYARRRFAVRDFRKSDDATLFVYGSITAGSLSATEPRFSTQLNFDSRLEDTRPPLFPATDRYEITNWDRAWTVSENEL